MEVWVGPVIVAAVVSGLVSAAGWFVTSWQAIRLEQRRRDEKVNDFQVALRAEIASDLANLEVVDREAFLAEVTASFAREPDFAPFIPRMATNAVFDVIVRDVHILPEEVITPVIAYARFRQTLERFVEDLRADGYRALPRDRQLTMYRDYIAMQDRLQALAANAVAALARSVSSSGAVPSTRSSGAEPGAAPGGGRDEP